MIYSDMKGYVSQIQSFSVNDGEGIRTNIFLSGCPLRCKWCANPETWTISPKIAVFKEKCSRCNKCIEVCPRKVDFRNTENNTIVKKCNACGICVEVCPSSARQIIGKQMSVKEVIKRVKRDIIFFRESGGGVTFSGGEPTFQQNFLRALVNALEEIGVHMAIETSGYFIWDEVGDIIEKLDFIFVDLKHMNSKKHKELTGVDNRLILENIKKIGSLNKQVVVRIPLIKGINDDEENIANTAKYVKQYVIGGKIEILPYHTLGVHKYETIELSRFKNIFNELSIQEINIAKEIICSIGVEIADYK